MAELFHRRLMSIVDDYGRYAYDIPVLLSRCFPRRPPWADEETLSLWATECRDVGLITIYEVNNHRYLEVSDFRQPKRSKHSKWPDMSSGCIADATLMKTGLNIPTSSPHTHTHTHSESEEEIKKCKLPVEEWFVEFWSLYWRKVDRANAFKAFKKYATDEETKTRIIDAVRAQTSQYAARESDKRPHAATWLNGRRYEDDPEVYQPAMSKLDRIMEAL